MSLGYIMLFLICSGLLVCYMTLKHLDSAKSMNWFLFYFHRFWRQVMYNNKNPFITESEKGQCKSNA